MSRISQIDWQMILSIIIITNVATSLGQSPTITSKNWIQVNKGNWPEPDDHDTRNQKDKQFYLFHQEEIREPLGFNKELWNSSSDSLISKPDLSLRYWTNSDLGRFRSQPDIKRKPKDVLLEQSNQWTTLQMAQITKQDWNNYTLFTGSPSYVLALKDIQVKYTAKLKTSNLERSPIHGYKSKEELSKSSIANVTPSIILAISGNGTKIEFQNQVNFSTQVLHFNLVQFHLKILPLQPNSPVQNIQIRYNSTTKKCFMEFSKSQDIDVIECEFSTIKDNITKLNSVTLKIMNRKAEGFVLLRPESVKLDLKNPNTLVHVLVGNQFRQPTAVVGKKYTINPSNPYLNLIDSQPDNHDRCYTLINSQLVPRLDIYLTLEGLNRGIKLTTITESVKSFCINDFVALRNLRNFQLTLSNSSKITDNFDIILTREKSINPFNPKTPSETTHDAQTIEQLTQSWYYFTGDLVDYQIHGDESEVAKLFICDIVANCFAYERKVMSNRKCLYTISEDYLKALDGSPFVRVKSDGKYFKKLTFDYYGSIKTILTKIKDKMRLEDSRKIKSNPPVQFNRQITFIEDFPQSDYYTIRVPINQVDLRIFRLIISIQKVKPKDEITLKELRFMYYDSRQYAHDLAEIFLIKRSDKQKLISISTEELFHMEPFEVNSTVNGYFYFAFDVRSQTKGAISKINITLTLEEVELDPQTSNISYMVLPLNLSKDPISHYPTLNKHNPKALITTGLVRAGFNRKVPEYHVRVSFKSSKPLKQNDLHLKSLMNSQTLNTEGYLEVIVNKSDNTTAYFEERYNESTVEHDGGAFEFMYVIELKDLTQQVQIYVEKFEMADPEVRALIGKAIGPVVATFDPRYDSLVCPNGFVIVDNTSCKIDYIYEQIIAECLLPDCSNIFNHPLPHSRNYLKSEITSEFIPYKTINQPNYLEVHKPTQLNSKNKDFCIHFSYQSPNSPLLISADNTHENPLTIEFEPEPKVQSNKICASLFTNDLTKIQSLYFEMKDQTLDLDSNYVEILGRTTPDNLYYAFEEGIYQDKLSINHFFDIFGKDSQKSDKNQILEFKITKLQDKIKDYNSGKLQSKVIKRYLRSKWIKVPVPLSNQIQITIKPEIHFPNDSYQISLMVSSPYQANLINRNLLDLNTSTVNIINFTSNTKVDYYQLTFKVEIDLTKIKSNEISEFSLALSHLTVNDPCLIESTGQLENCNHHGECHRLYEQFSTVCQCKPGFSEKDQCGSRDYCKMENKFGVANEKICIDQKLECRNRLEMETFECVCKDSNSTRWNAATKSCIQKEIPNCDDPNRIHKLNKNTIQCVCNQDEGYFELESGKACVKYDPCNLDHRKARNFIPKDNKLCSDVKAKCLAKSSNFNSSEYECICGDDHFNENGLKSQSAKCIPNICKTCEQTCEMDKDSHEYSCQCNHNYKLERGKCIVDESKIKSDELSKCTPINSTNQDYPLPFILEDGKTCKCPNLFTFLDQTKSCTIDKTKFICKQVEIKSDKQPGCACEVNGLKFDSITRRCAQECTDEFVQKCQLRNAQCIGDNDQAKCECSKDQVALALNSSNPEEWKCTPKCSLLDVPELFDKKCNGKFQKCDQTQMNFDKPNKEGIFLLGISQISSTGQYCQCEVGFVLKGGICQLSEIPIRVIKDMQFDLNSNMQIDKIQNAFTSLMTQLFNTKTIATECKLNEQKFISCSTSFGSTLNSTQIEQKLIDACIPIGLEKKKCMYLTEIRNSNSRGKRNSWNVQGEILALDSGLDEKKFESVLVSDQEAIQKVTVESIDYCSNASRCQSNYGNSLCKPKLVDKERLFECLCDESLFTVQSSSFLSYQNHNLRMQSCKLKDLCTEQHDKYGCFDPAAQCHLSTDFLNGSYVAQSYCSCAQSGLILTDRSRKCGPNSCDGYCMNNGDCGQDVNNSSRTVCHCADGFTGERCDKQLNIRTNDTVDGGTSNNAFKIATIVLSVVVGVGLLALVGMFVRTYLKSGKFTF